MSFSKVKICNVALALVGADSIRSFDYTDSANNNKRVRMCDAFYEFTKEQILAKHDWSFARKYAKLHRVENSTMEVPDGFYEYALPADSATPRDLYPFGSTSQWEIHSKSLLCKNSDSAYLVYTKQDVQSAEFHTVFANVLALGIAAKLANPIAQDKALSKDLTNMFKTELYEAWEYDSNIGNEYRSFDNAPENDTFVTGSKRNSDGYI